MVWDNFSYSQDCSKRKLMSFKKNQYFWHLVVFPNELNVRQITFLEEKKCQVSLPYSSICFCIIHHLQYLRCIVWYMTTSGMGQLYYQCLITNFCDYILIYVSIDVLKQCRGSSEFNLFQNPFFLSIYHIHLWVIRYSIWTKLFKNWLFYMGHNILLSNQNQVEELQDCHFDLLSVVFAFNNLLIVVLSIWLLWYNWC
jgi:hypothetical protein